MVQCVQTHAGGGIGIWDTLASMFNCAAFDVMQRWSKVVPVVQQEELVRTAIQRRIDRLQSAKAPRSGVSTISTLPHTVNQRAFRDTLALISQQVYKYNNSDSKLSVEQFWRAIAKHLNEHHYIVNGITPYSRCQADWHVLLEKSWKQAFVNTPSAVRFYVQCQQKIVSNMNAVVYHSSISTQDPTVRLWWRRHLYRNVYAVYKGCAKHEERKDSTNQSNHGTVERVVLNMLFAVELSIQVHYNLDQYGPLASANTLGNVHLPPLLFNLERVNVTIPPLPPPLSQQHIHDQVIARTAYTLQSLPSTLAALRWNQLASSCRTSVRFVQSRWRWLSRRASIRTSNTTNVNHTAKNITTKDYVLVVPESVDDNYW